MLVFSLVWLTVRLLGSVADGSLVGGRMGCFVEAFVRSKAGEVCVRRECCRGWSDGVRSMSVSVRRGGMVPVSVVASRTIESGLSCGVDGLLVVERRDCLVEAIAWYEARRVRAGVGCG